jgi:alkanesulfonate monooxygenase SsuD/methylene tetrahydromethanopterin reductase-like flavin-dependent oxidoreductase (luciferase family)
VTETSRQAEMLGAGALWATDHLFWGVPTLECLTVLTLAAAATQHATVGSCVLQLPLRAPAAVAKQASTLQLLSDGRFVLGVGAGSHEREYALAGAGFEDRGRRLDDGIAAVRRAWSTTEPGYRHEPALAAPIWVGGSSPAALGRAARAGDGWIPLFVGPSSMSDAVSQLREATAAAGRDPGAVTVGVVVMVSVGANADRAADRGTAWLASLYGIPAKAFARHLVAGTPAHCADALWAYLDAGAIHVAVMVAGDDPVDQFAGLASSFLERHAPAVLAGVGG